MNLYYLPWQNGENPRIVDVSELDWEFAKIVGIFDDGEDDDDER